MMSYTALMKAFKCIGDVDRAKAVLTTMKWDGIKPNNYSYTYARLLAPLACWDLGVQACLESRVLKRPGGC